MFNCNTTYLKTESKPSVLLLLKAAAEHIFTLHRLDKEAYKLKRFEEFARRRGLELK